MTDTDLAALAGISVLPMSRDESVWDMLDRSADKFDPKTGARTLLPLALCLACVWARRGRPASDSGGYVNSRAAGERKPL